MNRKISTPNFVKKIVFKPGDLPRASSLCTQQNNSAKESAITTLTAASPTPQQQQQHKLNNPPLISALSAAVFCQNRIVYNKNAHEELEVASLTKVMTFYCALKMAGKYEFDSDKVFVRVPKFAAFICGTSACLRNAEYIRLTDLFYALMLPSGNDAACTIANFFGYLDLRRNTSPSAFCSDIENKELMELYDLSSEGDIRFQHPQGDVQMNMRNFVKIMNTEAQRLQMRSTIYSNPHGLSDKGNKSSAIDYGRLCHFAMAQFQIFRKVVKTSTHSCVVYINCDYIQQKKATILASDNISKPLITSRKVKWENTNKLLTKNQYFIGIKTGCTPNAGPCLATHYSKDNVDLQVIVLKAKDSDKRWTDSWKLAEWMHSILQAEQMQQQQELGVEEQYQQSAKQRIQSPAKRKIKFSYNFERILTNEGDNFRIVEQSQNIPRSLGIITQFGPQPLLFQHNSNIDSISSTRIIESGQVQSQKNITIPMSRKLRGIQSLIENCSQDQRLKTCQETQQDTEITSEKVTINNDINSQQMFVMLSRNKSAAPYRTDNKDIKIKKDGIEKIPKKKPRSGSKGSSCTTKSHGKSTQESARSNASTLKIVSSQDFDKEDKIQVKQKKEKEQGEQPIQNNNDDEDKNQITFREDLEEDEITGENNTNDNQVLSHSFEDKMEEFISSMVPQQQIRKKSPLENKLSLKFRSEQDFQEKPIPISTIKPSSKPKTANVYKGRDPVSLTEGIGGLNKLFSPRRKVYYAQKKHLFEYQRFDSITNKNDLKKNQNQDEPTSPIIINNSLRKHSALSSYSKRLPILAINQSAIFQQSQKPPFDVETDSFALKSANTSFIAPSKNSQM